MRTRACYLAIGVDLRGRARGAGDLVAGDRGRQVLAGRPQRPAPPRRRGRPGLLRRRADRLPRSDRGRLPPSVGADLHRPPDPQLACATSPTKTANASPPTSSPIYRAVNAEAAGRRSRPSTTKWGKQVPDDRRLLAGALGVHHPVPLAARRPAPRRLHHQQHREPQPPDPQEHQDPRPLPRRTSRHQTHLPRHPAIRTQMATRPTTGPAPSEASKSTSQTDCPTEHDNSRPGLTHRSSDTLGARPRRPLHLGRGRPPTPSPASRGREGVLPFGQPSRAGQLATHHSQIGDLGCTRPPLCEALRVTGTEAVLGRPRAHDLLPRPGIDPVALALARVVSDRLTPRAPHFDPGADELALAVLDLPAARENSPSSSGPMCSSRPSRCSPPPMLPRQPIADRGA